MRLALFALSLAAYAQTCTFPIVTGHLDTLGNITGTCQPTQPPNSSCSTTFCDPTSVLVIVQDNTGPEPGTGGTNASQFVADHYMQVRGIPAANLVHVATFIEDGSGASCIPGGVRPHDPGTVLACDYAHSSSVNISTALYQSQIAAPVRAALTPRIKYIVPVYGVPTTVIGANGVQRSVDSALSALLQSNPDQILMPNPFANSKAHIDASPSRVLLVARLDGPSASASAALVDKALAGEQGISGKSYFDYGPSQPLGGSSLNAYQLCTATVPQPQNCILNDQSKTGAMIGPSNPIYPSAPMTAFAWGSYNPYDIGPLWNAYSFVPGAVASSMNSNSAQSIRSPSPGAVVYFFTMNGVAGTWGAVAEPYATGYTTGDTLLNALWNGYTLGEAFGIATPNLNWMMTAVGDPLYRPTLK